MFCIIHKRSAHARFWITVTCFLIALTTSLAGSFDDREAAPKAAPARDEEPPQAGAIDDPFSDIIELQGGDAIVGLEVMFYGRSEVALPGYSLVGNEAIVFKSTEKHALLHRLFEAGLKRCLRPVYSTKLPTSAAGGGGRPAMRIGRVTVTTKRDASFFIGISEWGFFLNSEKPVFRAHFFSWLAAKIVDDILFHEQQKRMPLELFWTLSGTERQLERRHDYLNIARRWQGELFMPQDCPVAFDDTINPLLTWHTDQYMEKYAEYLRKHTAPTLDVIFSTEPRTPLPFE